MAGRRAGGRGTFRDARRIIRQHAVVLPAARFTVIDPSDVADLLDSRRAEPAWQAAKRREPQAAVCADIYTRA